MGYVIPDKQPGIYKEPFTVDFNVDSSVSNVVDTQDGSNPTIAKYIAYDNLNPPNPFIATVQDGKGNVLFDGGFPKYYNHKCDTSWSSFSDLNNTFKYFYNALNWIANEEKVAEGNRKILFIGDAIPGEPYNIKETGGSDFKTSIETICRVGNWNPTYKIRTDFPNNQIDLSYTDLEPYVAVFLMSSRHTSTKHITDSTVNNMLAFREAGNGIFMITDHGSSADNGFYKTANYIAEELGAHFIGDYDRTPVNVGYLIDNYGNHPLWSGMSRSDSISAGGSESEVVVNETPISTSTDPLVVDQSGYKTARFLIELDNGETKFESYSYGLNTEEPIVFNHSLIDNKLDLGLKRDFNLDFSIVLGVMDSANGFIKRNNEVVGQWSKDQTSFDKTWFTDSGTNNIKVELGDLIEITLEDPLYYSKSMTIDGKEPILNTSPQSSGNYVALEWDVSDGSQDFTYMLHKKKSSDSVFQTIPAKENLKILNVYPENGVSETITFTNWKGETTTTLKSASLKKWMEEPNNTHSKGWGKGLIDVDIVSLLDFNNSPDSYLKTNGSYDYDVVVFGTWDCNGDCSSGGDTSAAAAASIETFIKTGRGVLLGHDTLHKNHPNFNSLVSYFNVTLDTTGIGYTELEITKKGLLTNYPWYIGDIGDKLSIPMAHVTNQMAHGDVWFKFTDDTWGGYDYVANDLTRNFYLTTWNNTALIQTGHSDAQATSDEQKLLANTLFYLGQVTTATSWNDMSGQDLAGPEKPVINNVKINQDTKKIEIDYSSPNDNGTTYDYYVTAKGSEGLTTQTNTSTCTIKTNIAGYSILVDDSPSSVPNNDINTTETSYDLEHEKYDNFYVHIAAVDNAGNISKTSHYHYTDNTAPDLDLTQKISEWTPTEETIVAEATDIGSGVSRIQLPNGEWVNQSKVEFKATSNGDYTFTAEDYTGNRTTKTITVYGVGPESNPLINLKITEVTSSTIDLRWEISETIDVDYINLMFLKKDGEEFKNIDINGDGSIDDYLNINDATSYSVNKLEPRTEYYFKIIVYDNDQTQMSSALLSAKTKGLIKVNKNGSFKIAKDVLVKKNNDWESFSGKIKKDGKQVKVDIGTTIKTNLYEEDVWPGFEKEIRAIHLLEDDSDIYGDTDLNIVDIKNVYGGDAEFVGSDSLVETSVNFRNNAEIGETAGFTYVVENSRGRRYIGHCEIKTSQTPNLVAMDDSFEVYEGGFVDIYKSQILANDYDTENNTPIEIVDVFDAKGGTPTVYDNYIRFQVNDEIGDPAQFRYTIRNSIGQETTAYVKLLIKRGLKAEDQTLTGYKGKEKLIPLSQLNITDLSESPPFEITEIKDTANGSLISYNKDEIRFVPTGEIGEEASFVYQVKNQTELIDEAKITLTIEEPPQITCNDDLFEVTQGKELIISKSNLSDNDTDSKGLYPLSVTSVKEPIGCSLSTDGDTIIVTPIVNAMEECGFKYEVENTEGIKGSGNVFINVKPLPEIEALIYENQNEIDNEIENIVPPTMKNIFNQWDRFDGDNLYTAGSSYDGNASSWQFSENPDRVIQPVNVAPYNGFLSNKEVDFYSHEATLTSSNGDNDVIGLVIAFDRDNNKNHTLSVIISKGDPIPKSGYGIVYDYDYTHGGRIHDRDWIVEEKNVISTAAGWSGNKIRVRVDRDKDIIKVYCSGWNNLSSYKIESEIVIDLNSDPRLERFKGKKKYGYGNYSQANTTYLDIDFKGGINYTKMYNFETETVYKYNIDSNSWEATNTTIQDELGYVREVVNPKTGERYLIKENEIIKMT